MRGIDVDCSMRAFLEMVRPKILKLSKYAIRHTSISMDTAVADFESQAFEELRTKYVMGAVAYPLHFLFGTPNGHLFRYANNYGKKTRRFESTHSYGLKEGALEGLLTSAYTVTENPEALGPNPTTQMARNVVEDGLTLSLLEYRIFKFCMTNAGEARRPLHGLHVFLSRSLNVNRARITRIYSDAVAKVSAETLRRLDTPNET